jgi:hypothetical protein
MESRSRIELDNRRGCNPCPSPDGSGSFERSEGVEPSIREWHSRLVTVRLTAEEARERVARIELASLAWKARALPLDDTRNRLGQGTQGTAPASKGGSMAEAKAG